MKKRYYIFGLIALILVGIVVFSNHYAKAISFFIEGRTNNAATTSPIYLTAGAASTTVATVSVGDVENVPLYANINVVASTTGTKYGWTIQYSMDGIDWFNTDSASSSPITQGIYVTNHSSSTPIDFWTPGTTSTTTKQVQLPNGVGGFVRMNVAASVGAGSIWVDILGKRLR